MRVTDAATEFAYDDASGFRFDIRYQGTAGNNAAVADANSYFSGSAGVARPLNNSLSGRYPYTFHSTVRDPQHVVPGPTLSGQNGFGASGFGSIGGDDGFGALGNNSLRALALAEQDQNNLQASSPTPQPSSSGARGVSHYLTSFCTFKI